MTDLIFTDRQQELMRIFKHGELARINILQGSVRSGKTWISLILWAFWVAVSPVDGTFLMVGKTLTALKRNCLEPLIGLVGEDNFSYSFAAKEGKLFGHNILLEGVSDARAEGKIRGLTLNGAYCDELTLFTEDFFTMLLSRLSEHGAKLFGTTNPDNPRHWLKVKYLDHERDLNLLSMLFRLEDNTTLDAEYVASIKKEYNGLFYKRFILGQWTTAEGAVYDMFSEEEHMIDSILEKTNGRYYVSCDYGTQNATVFLLWTQGVSGVWYCVREYYYSGREHNRQKTDEEYFKDFEAFLDGIVPVRVVIDPSASSFIAVLKQRGCRVKQAKNDVTPGIRYTGSLLSAGKLKFLRCCTNTRDEFLSYIWDSKAADKGEDKPVKTNDHAMDAVRYFAYTIIRRPNGMSILK